MGLDVLKQKMKVKLTTNPPRDLEFD